MRVRRVRFTIKQLMWVIVWSALLVSLAIWSVESPVSRTETVMAVALTISTMATYRFLIVPGTACVAKALRTMWAARRPGAPVDPFAR